MPSSTLCVVCDAALSLARGRGASGTAFPRGAWERVQNRRRCSARSLWGWRTFVPSEPRLHGRGHGSRAPNAWIAYGLIRARSASECIPLGPSLAGASGSYPDRHGPVGRLVRKPSVQRSRRARGRSHRRASSGDRSAGRSTSGRGLSRGERPCKLIGAEPRSSLRVG